MFRTTILALLPHKPTKSHVVTLRRMEVKDFWFKNVRMHRFHEAHR